MRIEEEHDTPKIISVDAWQTAIQLGMPVPGGTARIVFSGQLYGGEIWATGFYLSVGTLASPAAAAQLAHDVTTLLKDSGSTAAMSNQASKTWSTQTGWAKTSCYFYGTTGTKATIQGEWLLPAGLNGTGSGSGPNQSALVVSLRTATPGRSYRGRMFTPFTAGFGGASGQLAATDTNSIATAWAAAFSAMKSSSLGTPVVVSERLAVATTITAVVVNSRPDIQRRRANRESSDTTSNKPVA